MMNENIKAQLDQQYGVIESYVRSCALLLLYHITDSEIVFERTSSKTIISINGNEDVIRMNINELCMNFHVGFFNTEAPIQNIKILIKSSGKIIVSYNFKNKQTITIGSRIRKKAIQVVSHIRLKFAEHLREVDTEKNRPEGYYEEQAARLVLKNFVGGVLRFKKILNRGISTVFLFVFNTKISLFHFFEYNSYIIIK